MNVFAIVMILMAQCNICKASMSLLCLNMKASKKSYKGKKQLAASQNPASLTSDTKHLLQTIKSIASVIEQVTNT